VLLLGGNRMRCAAAVVPHLKRCQARCQARFQCAAAAAAVLLLLLRRAQHAAQRRGDRPDVIDAEVPCHLNHARS
jgi:hypothetical protein